ncbi:Aminoglycoside 6-adenylyltransferase [compost metagenome]
MNLVIYNIRMEYLIPLIEWYIANQHDWNVTTNKYGRLFKKYLTSEIWEKVERTFSGKNQNENWDALFAMADLVSEIGTDLSEKLGYEYPVKLERDIRQYLNAIQKAIINN